MKTFTLKINQELLESSADFIISEIIGTVDGVQYAGFDFNEFSNRYHLHFKYEDNSAYINLCKHFQQIGLIKVQTTAENKWKASL